ncbi:hypothetical protein Tco_1451131, partial [Tanacetum coccineum]
DVRVLSSKETPVKRKRVLSKEDDRKKGKGKSKKLDSDSVLDTDEVDLSSDEVDQKRKKLKIKGGLKRKRNGSDFDSSSVDEEKMMLLISKLKKKVKKEESDEESVLKKRKKKEKRLTPLEAAHEAYLSSFPTLRTRTSPSSLFSAIRNSRVNMLNFLSGIGFSSQCVPVGGYSLFDLDERQADHEFVRLWVGQFYPKPLKDIRVNNIASKLVVAQKVGFLFKFNFLMLFTNTMGMADRLKGQICLDVVRRLRKDCVIFNIDWCGYNYHCLQFSKLPERTNHYLYPFTFLVLFYLDSTKFDRFPVVRIYLHGEWTEVKVQETEGFTGDVGISKKEVSKEKLSLIYDERVLLEDYMRKASLEYPGGGKFIKLYEKYVQLFKESISFNDDYVGSGNDDGNGGDDFGDDDDGNGDDDAGVDDVGNGDDDGNGEDVDGNDNDKDLPINDREEPVEDDGGNRDEDGNSDGDDDGGRKSSDAFPEKQVESTEKQSTDPTGKENIIEEEADYITCAPEYYT